METPLRDDQVVTVWLQLDEVEICPPVPGAHAQLVGLLLGSVNGVFDSDVSIDSGMVWARADRPARMLVEVATSDSFKNIRSGVYVDALPETDFTAKALIEGLPAGQDIFYRIRFQDLSSPTIVARYCAASMHR